MNKQTITEEGGVQTLDLLDVFRDHKNILHYFSIAITIYRFK